jgi:hypothetical protein
MNRHAVPNATMGLPGKPVNGGSNPRFYEFDDGVMRLVKWHPSQHGPKACYNELVASRIGQLIEAPILRGGAVYLADEIIPVEHRAVGATAGFHFGMAHMKGENFVPAQHYREIANIAALPAAAILLAWLAVGDQEGHNQYLHQKVEENPGAAPTMTKHFRLIDMGQMFGAWSWSAPAVAVCHDRFALPRHMVAELSWVKLQPAIADAAAITDEAIRACFEDCPEEWAVSPLDRQGGAARVIAARGSLEAILRNGNPDIK